MPQLSEFINNLLTLSGIESDNEQLKLFLADEKLQNFEIHEDLTKKVNNSLMTLESAKNNKEVNDSFMAKFYGSIDAASKRTWKDLGLPEDKIAELDKITDTPKKIEAAFKEISDHAKSQIPDNSEGDEELKKKNKELADQVNELVGKVNEMPTILEKKEQELTKDFETKEISYKLGSMVSQYKLAEGKDLEYAMFKVNKEMEASDYVIDSTMNLRQKSNPELIAQKDNKNFTTKDWLDEIMSPFLMKSNGSTDPPTPHTVEPSEKPLKNNETGAHIQSIPSLNYSNENKPKTVKMAPPST